ncbi:MAG: hypothetical protein V1799_06535 [bacterium]
MEPESNPTAPNREGITILAWMIVGIVLVSIAYFIPADSQELWPNVNLALQIAGLYLLILLIYILQKPIRLLHGALMCLIVLVVMGFTFFLTYRFEDQTKWQAERLHKILGVIKEGIRTVEAPKILLKTLEAYHRKQMKQQKNLAETFKTLYPTAESGVNLFTKEYFPDYFWFERTSNPLKIFVQSIEPGTIVLVAMDQFHEGKNSTFNNYDGQSGRVQVRYTLTEKGITHVTEN